MNSRKLYSAINNIDDDLIENAKDISYKKVIPLKQYLSIAASFILLIGIMQVVNFTPTPDFDLRDRIVVQEVEEMPEIGKAPMPSKEYINIEGVITKVGKDGLSFKLDTGSWIYINEETRIGKVCINIEEKNNLLIESTFRVGNTIAGYSDNIETDKIIANVIYINWKFE